VRRGTAGDFLILLVCSSFIFNFTILMRLMQKYSRLTLLTIVILANIFPCVKKSGESSRQFAEITPTWFSRWPVAHLTRQRLSTIL
jgi:hypothetical protein